MCICIYTLLPGSIWWCWYGVFSLYMLLPGGKGNPPQPRASLPTLADMPAIQGPGRSTSRPFLKVVFAVSNAEGWSNVSFQDKEQACLPPTRKEGNSPSSVLLSCGASLSVVTPVGLRGVSGTEADGAPAEQWVCWAMSSGFLCLWSRSLTSLSD